MTCNIQHTRRCHVFPVPLNAIVPVLLLLSVLFTVPPGTEAVECTIQRGYDIRNLTRSPTWVYSTPDSRDCQPVVNQTAADPPGCTYTFSLCSKLQYPGMPEECADSMMCLVPKDDSVPPRKLADYTPDHNPFSLTTVQVNEFDAYYTSRQGVSPSCISTTVRLVYRCNHDVPWIPEAPPAVQSPVPAPVTIHYDQRNCSYTITLQYAGACYTFIPGDVVTPTALSAGSILLIMFFLCLTVYCGAGMIFKYTVVDARGAEIIPNNEFWAQFWSDTCTGVRYTGSVVTCQGKGDGGVVAASGSGQKPGHGTYDAI